MRLLTPLNRPTQRRCALLSVVVLLGSLLALFNNSVVPSAVSAQDNTTITPTVAPTKTSVPATPTQQSTPEVTESPVVPPVVIAPSLTQGDLSILTGNVQRPNGIVWFDGKLYISCSGDWTLYEIDTVSGQTEAYIYGIRNAHSMHAEMLGNELTLWIPDFQSNAVTRVDRNGIDTVVANLNGPWAIAQHGEDAFLVTNLLGNNLIQVSRDGAVEQVVSDLMAPTGLVVNGDTLYVANNGSTRRAIEWYTIDATPTANAASDESHVLVSGLQNTTGLALGADGYLYFAYSLGTRGVVGRVNPEECRASGGCTHDQVQIVVLTELAAPLAGLTISPDMRLYVHTMFSPDVYWVQLEGAPVS